MAQPAKTASPGKPSNSTQSTLLISEIKDGVVVMRDGSLRAVILGSAINFDLMSQQEQDAVEYAYQGFLNSLHWPIQITIKSHKIDLDGYIEKLNKMHSEQDNELLAVLMEDYIANIKALVDEVNIMDKQFFITVPYFPPAAVTSKGNVFTNLAGMFKATPEITVGENEFNEAKRELAQRVQVVAAGLTQMGVRAIPLNTQELIDLVYSWYNPDVAVNQKLIDSSQMQTPAVTRGGGQVPNVVTPTAPLQQPAVPPVTVPQQPVAAPQATMPQPSNPLESTPMPVGQYQPPQVPFVDPTQQTAQPAQPQDPNQPPGGAA